MNETGYAYEGNVDAKKNTVGLAQAVVERVDVEAAKLHELARMLRERLGFVLGNEGTVGLVPPTADAPSDESQLTTWLRSHCERLVDVQRVLNDISSRLEL